jgi:succinate dehydrogenase/fumarate reductase flavoprotein subunit
MMAAEKFDVVVLGSGAAGLTAALAASGHGASVLVLEKADQLGGTSAWSGGMIWIPNNPHMRAAGIADSREEALTYLRSLSHDLIPDELAQAYVDHGAEMVEWLEERTSVRFQLVPEFPDYHPEFPGGKPAGGRSLECPLLSFKELGEHAQRVTVGSNYGTAPVTMEESHLGRAVPVPVSDAERERRSRDDVRGCGQSLIGHLFKACIERDIEIRTDSRATEFAVEGQRMAGVHYVHNGTPALVESNSVILASGGFEWNRDLVHTFLRGPMTHPVSVPTNEGDALLMCMRIGVSLGNMREAWWMPAVEVPHHDGPRTHLFAAERARPRSIMVNRKGRRFTNEAANYNAFGAAFHEQDVAQFDYANLPCWFVFDQGFLHRFGFIDTPAGAAAPNWLTRAATLDELASQLGCDAEGLKTTVAHWNDVVVANGRDEQFQRGESVHDNWWGDPQNKGTPAATLGPLDEPPFYAVEVKSGALGTKGGPRTDSSARVLNVDGEVIPGLYAAGNVMASAMGMTYGGAGGTLGPGMVFGYLAGKDAAAAGN